MSDGGPLEVFVVMGMTGCSILGEARHLDSGTQVERSEAGRRS